MEKLKQEMSSVVEDYSVSETTLEQVFLSFAKHQRPESDKERLDDHGDTNLAFQDDAGEADPEIQISRL